MTSLHLTKSRYIAGLQCLRRLWLLTHESRPYEEPVPGSRMDLGQEIGRKARLLFPGGVTIGAEPWEHALGVAQTATLIGDNRVPAIFEAAFEYDGIRIRVDVLERLADGTWGLREVKSGSGLKDHYVDDIALQTFVLKGAGIAVSSVELIHVNTAYRRRGDICWADFFARLDVRDAVAAKLVELPTRLPAMRDCLCTDALPDVEPGEQCTTPYACEFWDRCTANKPADWTNYLPYLSQARVNELKALGIESISSIPADFRLTPYQGIIQRATATGQPYVASDLAGLLEGSGPPTLYLDFEAMMPPIPLYEGTSPYQTIPFQWSLHAIAADGILRHEEFLAEGGGDPRRRFATTLIEALDAFDTPVIVYSGYEQARLNELATELPDLGQPLNRITSRLVDLLPVVRGGVYFPEFHFSNSLKAVAPVLCDGFGYNGLDGIADGIAASDAFLRLASGHVSGREEADRLRVALLAYCRRDTLALVEVHRALRRLASARGSQVQTNAVAAGLGDVKRAQGERRMSEER
jgi:hypothetical protein